MIWRACFSILVSLLLAGASVLGSAIAALPDNCSYFTGLNKEKSGIKILELLDELPEGSAIVICKTPFGRDSIEMLSSVSNRDSVSYYKFSHYSFPQDTSIADMSVAEFLQQDVVFFGTMMALDEDGSLTHLDQAFIEANYVSIGAFKRFYPAWAKIFENPKRRGSHPDLSRLEAGWKLLLSGFSDL